MSKRHISHFLLVGLSFLTAFVLLLGACATPPRGINPVKGGTWIDDLYEEPDSLIPNASPSGFSDLVDQAIYAPLFVGDSTGSIQPGLVTVIPTIANGGISADLKNWTSICAPI